MRCECSRWTWCLAVAFLLLHGRVSAQTLGDVRVLEEPGGTTTYRYVVKNTGTSSVTRVIIGLDYESSEPELLIPPVGWSIETGIPSTSATSPLGWSVDLVTREESNTYRISWDSSGTAYDLAPGATLEGLAVTIPSASEPYRSAHWTVIFADSSVAWGTLLPADVTAVITPGGAPVTVNTTIPGQNARITFDGTVGQRVSLRLTDVTIGSSSCCSLRVSIANPDGTSLVSPTYVGTAGDFIDTRTLPITGTYTILLDPEASYVGSATLALYDVPPDATGSLTSGGPPLTLTMGTPGQNGQLTFSGAANQRVRLEISSVTIGTSTCCSSRVSILNPDGSTLVSPTFFGTSGKFIETLTLGTNGTYTVLLDPDGANVGSANTALYEVPQDVTGSMVLGGASVAVTIGTPGQNARIEFTGTAGQQVALQLSPVTIAMATVSIRNPDGTTLVTRSVANSGAIIDNLTLPANGTYAIIIDPSGANTGSVTLTLFGTNDVTATITLGGAPVIISIGTSGQNARVTFTGTAGQRISLRLSNVSIAGNYVSILNPDGSFLVSPVFVTTTGSFIDTRTLTSTGTHTILIDPSGSNTGSMTLTLYDVPADITSTIAPGGASVAVTLVTAGQNGRVTFSRTAGQRISLRLSNVTIASSYVSILNPDGSTLVAPVIVTTTGTFIDVRTLVATGTHTIFVDPSGTNTGSVSLTLYDVPSDITGSISIGAPVALTVGTAGQNARLTFTGSTAQRISLRLSSVTIAATNVSILNPDGSTLVSPVFIGTTGGFIDTRTLTATGTHTIVVDPSAANTGSITLTLYEVPPDATGTVTVGGSGVGITTATPGQNASISFAGTSGQQVTVRITGNTMGLVTVKLMRPDGTMITTSTSSVGSFNLATQTLASTGTYTISIDPSGTNVGSQTVTVTSP
jgi:hypothetical protein